ncbi:MAG: SMI1/KNR4 family protein [Anaerolineae bacterium]|nr:SMI1/KNR4 family protein [Anaerolineae bacterium]
MHRAAGGVGSLLLSMKEVGLPNRARVRELLGTLPHPPELGVPPGITDGQIDGFVRRTGIPVPDQLREWLNIANGPYIGSRATLGIRTADKYRDIEALLQIAPAWKSKAWIPIASDGCGNYYILPTQQEYGEGYPVVFVEVIEKVDEAAYIVASDIAHFLAFLMEDELKLSDKWPFEKAYVTNRDPEIVKFHNVALPWGNGE